MKSKVINLVILIIFFSQFLAHKAPKNDTKSGYKTFLVKTQIPKEKLLALLKEGEKQKVNLKANENINKTGSGEGKENTTEVKEVDDQTLQEQIEDEIQEDALQPLEEFHVKEVKQSEVKTFVNKPKTKFIDSLYEKRFGKIYGYLTLFLFAFVLLYNKDKIFNQKTSRGKPNYSNLFEFDSSKEYMIIKHK